MNYWLDLFTPYTWERFRQHGATISGFRPRQRRVAFERVKPGDVLLCYLVKLSRWCGALEVLSDAFEDSAPIFADENDPFPIRFKVNPRVMLDFEHAIPIERLWTDLSFTNQLRVGSVGWAQAAKLRQSLVSISNEDGAAILRALERQKSEPDLFALDHSDMRHIGQRTVVRTESGVVEVEVPDRDVEELAEETSTAPRLSIKMQAQLSQLGAILGFTIWIPPSDRARVLELLPANHQSKIVGTLPLNYDHATLKTIENIDVIWLDRRAIAHAFEVEHTTAIYSGLLRMADLLAMQPRMNITLHIVAPIERRDQVRREIVRPVFSVLEGGAMAERCSFLSYDAVEELLGQPNLAHLRETILEDFEEYFDAA
jgi:EVE domain